MMPYIQGDVDSLPDGYDPYHAILAETWIERGEVGYLTIDESVARAGRPHRGDRAKHGRALHTEAGRHPDCVYAWGGGSWGGNHRVMLDADTQILLASNVSASCAVWDAEHAETSLDGDIGHVADQYPYDSAIYLQAGEVVQIGILTPHESLPVPSDTNRQFLRIVGRGVWGREPYFTINPRMESK